MKIGFDQLGVPAPLLVRRAVNGFIAILQPGMVTLVLAIPEDMISKDAKILLMAFTAYLGVVGKWLESILGVNAADIQATKEGEPK